jgi:hypothetical protein
MSPAVISLGECILAISTNEFFFEKIEILSL